MINHSKAKIFSILALLTIILISGIYSIFLMNFATQNHVDSIEREVEILIYRLGESQKSEIDSFQNFYEKLEPLSLMESENNELQYAMDDIFSIDKTVQLVVDDGRLMSANVSQEHTDAETMKSFFGSSSVVGRNLFEIEAFSASEQQLIGAVSRKLIDKKSEKSAVLLKLLDLSDFIQELKTLFNNKNAMIFIMDENNRFADVFGSSHQMIDVAGIKALATKAQYKGILKNQTVNGQMYDVVYKEIRDLNWSMIILMIEPPGWTKKSLEILAVLSIFILGISLLIVLYKSHHQLIFQRDKDDAYEEIYDIFNRKDGVEQWESDERHLSKHALDTLSRVLPFMRMNPHDKVIIESALSQIQLGSNVSMFEEPSVEHRKVFNREVVSLLKAVFSDLLLQVEVEVDLDTLEIDFDFSMLQILIIIGDCIEVMALPGRVEIRGDSGSQALVIEFHGELQRKATDIYKSLINNNEYYHLHKTINILKLGNKIIFNKKNESTDMGVKSSDSTQLSDLPSHVYFVEEFSQESLILQMMIKSLGVEVRVKKADSSFTSTDIIFITDSFLETVMKNQQLSVAKRIIYGKESPATDMGESLFIERPYQLHKIRYVMMLAMRKEA